MGRLIFHITTRAGWEAARASGRYSPPSLAAEGFIHFSNREQVATVANARYAGARGLVLLCVAADRLDAPLRDETSDAGDERFPHLYGALNLAAVVRVAPFAETGEGFAAPPEMPLVAVTGASGAVGRRLTARLAEAGVPQRLVVRDPARAPEVAGAEVVRAAGYGAGEEMRAALEGAGTLFLIPAAEAPDRVEQHKTAVDAAVAAGVERIVYLSFFGASPDTTFTLGRDHWHTEQHIRATGLPWTFLRMNLYMDFIPTMVMPDGVMRGPAGDGRLAAVLRDDVAAAGAAVLTSGGHDGRAYALTGPEAFSLAEAAAVMSAATGKPIRFHDESDEEAFASRAGFGAPEFEVRGWVSSYWAIRDGSLEPATSDVRTLTGRDPVALSAYLAAHPEALDHVRGDG